MTDETETRYRKRAFAHRSVRAKGSGLKVALLLFLLSFTPALLSPVSAASVFYVSTGGSDTTGTGSASSPFATITHAVGAASAGDTILVGPGTYHEMVNVTKTLTIQSLSADPSNTVVDATGLSMGFFVLGSSAARTVVSGFTVENANNHGFYAQDTSGVIFEHNVASRNGQNPTSAFSGEDKAIELVGTSRSLVVGNTVVDNLYGGIAINDNGPINPGFYSPGTLTPSVGNIISGNTVIGNRPHHCSIVVSAYDAGAGVYDTIVSNNVVVDNSAGVVIAADVPNSEVANTTVAFNTILNNGEAGIVLHDNGLGGILSGTVVMGNTISGNGIPVDVVQNKITMIAKFTGILVGGENTKVAPKNTVIAQNVIQSETYGVYIVNASSYSILGNMMGPSVVYPVGNGTLSEDPTLAQIGQINNTIATLQNDLGQLQTTAAKQSDIDTISSTLSGLSNSLTQLQGSSVNAGALTSTSQKVDSLSNTVSNLSASLAMTSYFAYAALVVAILMGALVLALSRRPRQR